MAIYILLEQGPTVRLSPKYVELRMRARSGDRLVVDPWTRCGHFNSLCLNSNPLTLLDNSFIRMAILDINLSSTSPRPLHHLTDMRV
jgi:hypothetical protein